jgi:hypothetical protein
MIREKGAAQAVEHLPSKCKALISNLSTTKKDWIESSNNKVHIKLVHVSSSISPTMVMFKVIDR